jgi:heat-inducible transcriptional repressor
MLKPRQETILKLIVDDYVRSAMPVGSGTIAKHHDLEVSPATIRNEVAELEDAGYIARPYASAGSVPLDKAYRFYVESQVTVEAENIPAGVRSSVRRRFGEVRDADSWAEVAAAILARLVGNLAIVTFPRATESRVKHLELVPLEELVTMLILVFEHARLKRHIIRFDDPIEPRAREELAVRVKEQLIGLTLREIEAKRMPLSSLEEEIVDAAIAVLREEEQALYRDHYVDGLRNLLNQPEFTENDRMRALVVGLEDGSLVEAVLGETPDGRVVRVIIGRENHGDLLRPLSVVVCQYGIPGEAVGAVGAVGPTRMEYTRTIAGVDFVSSVMSDMVEMQMA